MKDQILIWGPLDPVVDRGLNKEVLEIDFNCCKVVFIKHSLLIFPKRMFNHVSAMSTF